MRTLRVARLLASALLALACASCSTDDDSDEDVSDTLIIVSPTSFLGGVACSTEPGAMQSYVATLYVWADAEDTTAFTVGSSYPTPCSRSVTFQSLVTAGAHYTADVDGYDRPASELAPFGGTSSGAREMLDAETDARVTPRWTTSCGTSAADAVTAVEYTARFVPNCEPLSDAMPTTAAISFPPAVALGDAPCAVAASLTVTPEATTLAPAELGCDAEPLRWEEGVEPDRGYYFYVAAQGEDGLYGTECFATARTGVTVTPICNGLSTTGSVVIRLAGLSNDDAPLCAEGLGFEVTLGDGTLLTQAPVPCSAQAQLGALEPGPIVLGVRVVDGAGTPTGDTAQCTAEVRAGTAVEASCAP